MAEIDNQIHFEQLGLGSVLKRYQLSVPPNQREYSWTEREITMLLQDFSKAISDEEPGYFLGTIVTIPHKNFGLEVVDGQQRLATTAILLSSIRDYLRPREDLIAKSVDSDFLMGIDRARREQVPKLSLNLVDNDFFKTKITGAIAPVSSRPSHLKIETSFSLCQAHVKNIVKAHAEKDHGDILNKWISFIENRALVVLLRVTDDSNAYKMFETLNDRGLKTSQSDLVKNYLFGRAGESRIGEVQQKWTLMRGALESLDNEDISVDFLRHAITTMHGFVREAQVYEKVQEVAKSPQPVVTFATNLEILSNIYVAIHNPEHEKWNKYNDNVRRSIIALNLFNIRPMRPLMLAIANKFSEAETAEAFKFLIILSVRLLIAGTTRSGSTEQPLAINANKVFSSEITTASALKKAFENIMPTDNEFRTEFETATVSSAKLARYYIRSLEMVAKEEAEPWLIPNDDRQIINLEHVLPRKPENNWPEFTEEQVSGYVNRIGNLALLQATTNSNFKSAGFAEKKATYATSPYALTKQIADAEKWTIETITERQRVLAGLSLKAWPI